MSILIKGIDMPKGCDETCPLYLAGQCCEGCDCPLIEIDIVRCGECKHKPIKHDPEDDDFGFNLVSPNGYDNLCPCLNTDDGFYSYMPEDDFFCAFGERRDDETQP